MRRGLLVVAVVAVALAGCGGKSDEQKAKDAAVGFFDALQDDNGDKACGLLAPGRLTVLARQYGQPVDNFDCASNISDEVVAKPRYPKAEAIDMNGNTATVKVGGDGGSVEVQVRKVGDDWKISRWT